MKHAKQKSTPTVSERSRRDGPGPGKAPEEKSLREKARKETGERAMNVLPVLLLLLVAGAVVLTLFRGMNGSLWYEDNVTIGKVSDSREQLKKLQEMVDKGMITMSINASPVWYLSQKEAGINWLIENPAEQSTKLIRVEVYQDETGDKIYETGAIKPGSYVTGTAPNKELEVGQHICTAYFYSYDIDTKEYIGKAGAQIVLTVLP